MRIITLTFAAIAFAIAVTFAQSPQAFKYQAIARDNSGNVLANQPISIRVSILSGLPTGTNVVP